MSCFICYTFTGLGCEYCRDQLSAPTINCTHSPNDWHNPCYKCMYEGMRGMSEEELLGYQINQLKALRMKIVDIDRKNNWFWPEFIRNLCGRFLP